MSDQPNSFVPKNISELTDYLGFMMLNAPKFIDDTGHFPQQNIETVFSALNAAIRGLRTKLGQERFDRLLGMSDQMRSHFKSDPDEETGSASKGRQIILEMKELIRVPRAKN